MEDIPVERGCFEVAEMEEPRARQSEYVNLQAVHLHQRLETLLGPQLTASTSSSAIASLSPQVIEALECYVAQYEADMDQMETDAARFVQDKERATSKAASFAERAERMHGESSYLSEKNSASLKDFRQQLQQSGERAKERNRELAALNRKREKAEMDIKRTDMEIARLRKITKHNK